MQNSLYRVDHALLRRACEGDQDSFWQLMLPFRGLIYSVALGMWKNPERAEDQLHDVLLTAWRSLSQLRDPDKLGPWLYSLTRNRAMEQIRREERLTALLKANRGQLTPIVPIDELRDKEAWLIRIEEAMGQLPEPFRVVLALKYMERASCKEIATLLDLSIAAVKSRLFEARKALRRLTEALAEREESEKHELS